MTFTTKKPEKRMFIGLYKLISMFLSTLRGSDTPRQLAFGIALGMLFGILPKDNLIVAAVGLLIIATNSNMLMATLSGFAFVWVGFWLEPVSDRLGLYLLTQDSLVPMMTRVYELPLVPWTRFNNTVVCGSLVIGSLSFIPLYQFSRLYFFYVSPRLHQRLRRFWVYAKIAGPEKALTIGNKHAIRWGWVVPRLVMICVICGSVYYFKDRAIEYAIEQAGSSAVGAQVEIGCVKSDLAHGTLRLHDIHVTNPKSTQKDLIRTKYASLDISTTDLLRKKFVIEEAKLAGVEFQAKRKTDGALPSQEQSASEPGFVSQKMGEITNQLTGALKDSAMDRLEENLATVRLSKELMEYWPQEYASLKQQATLLQKQLKDLRNLKELKFDNPLRDLQKYQEALAQINQTHQRVVRLQNQLKNLHVKFDSDQKSLLAAKEIDKQNIKQLIKSSEISGKSLSQVLLGEQQGQQLDQLLGWVRWMRETVPDPEHDFQPERNGGQDILFPGLVQTPDLLIKNLSLTGKGKLADDTYQFQGSMRDFTTQPKLLGKPTVINLATKANTDVKIRAIIDQTGDVRRDTLLIQCPRIDIKSQKLGSKKSLLVAMAPAKMEMQVKLQLVENRVDGKIEFVQSDVKLSLDALPKALNDEAMKQIVDQELAKVNQFRVVMLVSGEIDRPQWEFESDLGEQLAGAMNSTVQRSVDLQVARLEKQVDAVVGDKISELNALVANKHAEVKHLLDSQNIDVADLQNTVKRVIDLPLLRR
jgi:uncharacterized protein (TIGR03545 family)/uncharacterized protein (TIGR03546 family)